MENMKEKEFEYSIYIKDKILYYGNFSNDYFIDKNLEINKNELSSYLILVSDDDSLPGKTKLCDRLIYNNKFDDSDYSIQLSINYDHLEYIYHQNKYFLNILDTPRDRYRFSNLLYIENLKPTIIIYVFKLKRERNNEKRISEEFIDQLIEKKGNSYIYLVGTRLDDFYGDLNDYRKQAQELIDKGKIKKYFEGSSETGEGIELLVKNIKIDNEMLLNGTNTNFSLDELESFRDFMKNKKLAYKKNKKFIYLKKYINF